MYPRIAPSVTCPKMFFYKEVNLSTGFFGGIVVAEIGFNFTATFLEKCYACYYLALMRQN